MKPKAIILIIAALLALSSPSLARNLYVSAARFHTIQEAINAAFDGDVVNVAPGTYTGTGNWDIDFLGKAITVRSKNGPGDCIIDCNDITGYYPGGSPIYNRHSGFLFQNNEDANSVLDGFTITRSTRPAIYCELSSPTITNCVLTKNTRYYSTIETIYCDRSSPIITNCTISNNIGVGIYLGFMCSPVITNCIISGNTARGLTGSGARYAGGIYCYGGQTNPIINNCIITGNSGNGGIYFAQGQSGDKLTVTNCTITANVGGGIYCLGAGLQLVNNCTIAGNFSRGDGGGIFCSYGSTQITNCTITGNSARRNGGGIYSQNPYPLALTNSIIWDNNDVTGSGQSAQVYGGKPNIWYSCIQDDNPDDVNIPFGEDIGNIDDDPCFVNTGTGYWDNNSTPSTSDDKWIWLDGDYHLLPDSPCIETGNPSFKYHPSDVDMDGQPRLMGRYVDMGADEFDLSVIIVTKPQGGEIWSAGSTHEINWDSYSITGTVDISYSINNGASWTKIANAPDTGSYTWDLPTSRFPWFRRSPPLDSSRCLISVEPNTPPLTLTRIDSGLFTIQPYRSLPPQPWWPQCRHNKFGPKFGYVQWLFQTGGPVTAGVAIGFNNNVHIPCEDGKLYALNCFGKLLWTYDTNSPLVGSPSVDRSGNVYVGAENGKLYAIDRNGRLLWTHTTNGPIYSSPVVSTDSLLCCPRPGFACPHWKKRFPLWHYWHWEQPVNIFVCSVDGTLYALDYDGSELWSFETGSLSDVTTGAIFASPAIDPDKDVHIAGLHDPNLYAIDSNSITEKWNCKLSNLLPSGKRPWPFASPVIADNGTIYQTALYDPNLYAVNPNDGSIIWSANMADSGWFEPNYAQVYGPASCWSTPALAPDGTIYVNLNDPYLRAVDPNGNIKWVTKLGNLGGFTMTVGCNGLIYAACDDANLYVVDPNGLQVAQFEGYGALSFPTITAGQSIIVSDANNAVWAVGGNNCWVKPVPFRRPVYGFRRLHAVGKPSVK